MSIIDYVEEEFLDWEELSPANQMGFLVSPFGSFEEHMEYVNLEQARITPIYRRRSVMWEDEILRMIAHEQLWADAGQREASLTVTRYLGDHGLEALEDRLRTIGYCHGSKPDTMDELPF